MEEVKKERPKDIGRACRVMATSRSSMSYTSVKDDTPLTEALQKLAADHPREGFCQKAPTCSLPVQRSNLFYRPLIKGRFCHQLAANEIVLYEGGTYTTEIQFVALKFL